MISGAPAREGFCRSFCVCVEMTDIEEYMETKQHYTYFWENRLDGTMYVGSGKDRRYLTHKVGSSNTNLKKAIDIDGAENFEYGIFQYYDTQMEARLAEQYWFDYLQEMGVKLYNIATKIVLFCGNVRKFDYDAEKQICDDYVNGKTSYELGEKYKCDPTTVCNILKRHEIQARQESGMLGKTHTQEWKDHMSEIMAGRVFTDEHRKAISDGSMGKPGTNTGKTFDDEWRKNQAKALKGLDRSKQHRFQGEEAQEICDLYHIFRYDRHILAKLYDCYSNVIRDVLIRNNIPIRPSRQAQVADKLKNRYAINMMNWKTMRQLEDCLVAIPRQ